MTEVFVLDDGDDPALSGKLPPIQTVDSECVDETRVAAVGPVSVGSELAVDPVTTGSVASEPVVASPMVGPQVAVAEPVVVGAPGAPYNVDAQTGAAAHLATLLDLTARIDGLIRALDERARVGIVEESPRSGGPSSVDGLALSNHALVEAVARSERLVPSLSVGESEPAITADIPTRSITGSASRVFRSDPPGPDDNCADLLGSLVEHPVPANGLGPQAGEIVIVPIEGCVPDPTSREKIQSLLGGHVITESKLTAAGYRTSDILGGSVDDKGRLLLYVANQLGMEPAIAFRED